MQLKLKQKEDTALDTSKPKLKKHIQKLNRFLQDYKNRVFLIIKLTKRRHCIDDQIEQVKSEIQKTSLCKISLIFMTHKTMSSISEFSKNRHIV